MLLAQLGLFLGMYVYTFKYTTAPRAGLCASEGVSVLHIYPLVGIHHLLLMLYFPFYSINWSWLDPGKLKLPLWSLSHFALSRTQPVARTKILGW